MKTWNEVIQEYFQGESKFHGETRLTDPVIVVDSVPNAMGGFRRSAQISPVTVEDDFEKIVAMYEGRGDDLGDRMKDYERNATENRFMPGAPVYARLDGRGFSKLTKKMRRPFDPRMSEAMRITAAYLVEQTQAKIAYFQSDEISLCWMPVPGVDGWAEKVFFGGKVHKMTSVLASMATARFVRALDEQFGDEYKDRFPHFDTRVFALPSQMECANAFLWRALDAERNAMQMVAHHNFSHRALHQKSTTEMRTMLLEKGVYFAVDYPPSFRFGSFLKRVTKMRALTSQELMKIPEKHRETANVPVLRHSIDNVVLDHSFRDVEDRVKFIFGDYND